MSLSDYSSDDSFEAEDSQVSQKAVKGLQKAKMNAKGTRSSDAGFSTMFLGAMAALAVAGVAAGTLYLRQHSTGRRPTAAGGEEGHDKRRKDLRRKRGEVKESPRAQPFMARTESASSVGPLRKHPRRDTSEESGGEASGSSPTAGAGRAKALRRSASKNRHKRPPLRAPAFEAQKEVSEEEKAGDAEEGTAPEGPRQTEAVAAEQVGSRAMPMPIGVDPASNGMTEEAAERTPASRAAGSYQDDSKQQAAEKAASCTANSAEVGAESTEQASSAAEPSPSPAAAGDIQEATQEESAPRNAEDRTLPDLLGEPKSAAAATQPSLDTFTADCDVLDQAVDAVEADAESPAGEEAAKGPEKAPSKDAGPSNDGGKGHSEEVKEVEAPKKDAESTGEERAAGSKQDADALQEAAGAENQDSAAAKGAGALGERAPEEAAAVQEPTAASKPQGSGGAAAPEEGPGKEFAQAQGSKSREVQPQAAPADVAAAEDKDSVSRPEGPKHQQDDSAKEQTPVIGAAEVSPKLSESGSGPHSEARSKEPGRKEAPASDARRISGKPAESGSGRHSTGEEPGRKEAPVSDEQKAIMERGDSMLAEADEADPKGIQLIRKLQAEVDKQDDMLDFSKTDAYRSCKQRQSEEQASAPGHQKSSPTDTGDKTGQEAPGTDQHQEPEGAERAADKPDEVQPVLEAEPSLELLDDPTPGGEELDLSSAEVSTVNNITGEEPEQAAAQEENANERKPAAEKKSEDGETPHPDGQSTKTGKGAEKGESVIEKPGGGSHPTDAASREQPETETLSKQRLHSPEAQSSDAHTEAEQLPTAPASDQKHTKEQPEEASTSDQSPAAKEPEAAPKTKQDHAEEQPEAAPKADQSRTHKEPAVPPAVDQRPAEEQPEEAPTSDQRHAEEQPEEPPTSDQRHAEEQPEEAPTSDQSHAEEQPEVKTASAGLSVQEHADKEMPKPAGEPSTPEQALTTDAHGRSRPEQGITSGAADGPQPDSALTAQRSAEPPREGEQPKPASADAAGAPGEASQHSASALAGAAAAAAATLATEDRDALITSQPSVGTVETRSGSKGTTEGLTGAEEPEAAAAKAPYDPLGMDAPDEAPDPAEVVPDEAGAEAEEDVAMPRNNTERDVQLNLAVALRMVEERGNIAAAERTLQKQLAAVKESRESIRPEFMQRLAGTLADVIARAAHQDAAAGKQHSPSQPDRMTEIVDLLQTAFQSAKTADDPSRSREGWRLGNALLQADRLDEAEALFKEEVKYSEHQLGAQNANTQQTRAYLAEVLAKKGNKAEAYKLLSDSSEQLEQQAKELSSSKGAEPSPDGAADGEEAYSGLTAQATATMSAAKCSVKLATMQDEDKDYKEAEASARRAVRLMEGAFGKNNPRNSTAYGTLAAILKHAGGEQELREAIVLYTQLQHTMEDIHGLRNAQSALALRSIADVHLMLKEYGEAVQCLEKARQIAASVHGRDHPILESFWEALAEAKKEAGDKQGAKEASRQALLVKSHAHRPGGGQRSPRESGAARRGKGRSRR